MSILKSVQQVAVKRIVTAPLSKIHSFIQLEQTLGKKLYTHTKSFLHLHFIFSFIFSSSAFAYIPSIQVLVLFSIFFNWTVSPSSLQVTPCYPLVKQTTCRTPATARSPPAPASAPWTRCRLPGSRTGVPAVTEPTAPRLLSLQQPPLRLLLLLQSARAQQRHMHTPMLITTSPAQGNYI